MFFSLPYRLVPESVRLPGGAYRRRIFLARLARNEVGVLQGVLDALPTWSGVMPAMKPYS